MSNPLYEMMEQMKIKKDIAEIDVILSGYANANGIYNKDLDIQARNKIEEMQRKDPVVFATTAPKPGTQDIPWAEVTPLQFYNILTNIRNYLEAKMMDKVRKQQGENNHA